MIASDDRYRMVEDEFLHVAQRFTTHLHRAEYNRLKALAKSQNAAAIRAIERPVVGPPTRISRNRRDALGRAARQRTLTGQDDDESSPWMARGLRGLMESPRREARTIRSYAVTAPSTRAAAGFGSRVASPALNGRGGGSGVKRQVKDESDETSGDSDLGSPTPKSTTTGTRRANTFQTAQTTDQPLKLINRAESEPNLKRPSRSSNSERPKLEQENYDDDYDDPFDIKRRKIRRAKSREQIQKPPDASRAASPDLIPSFL